MGKTHLYFFPKNLSLSTMTDKTTGEDMLMPGYRLHFRKIKKFKKNSILVVSSIRSGMSIYCICTGQLSVLQMCKSQEAPENNQSAFFKYTKIKK